MKIPSRIRLARAGKHPSLISRLKTGWLVLADPPCLEGHLILLADPPARSLNDLDEAVARDYLLDVWRSGNAILRELQADRVNYEIMGNYDKYLHAHIIPRKVDEPDRYAKSHPIAYKLDDSFPAVSDARRVEIQNKLRLRLRLMADET